MIWCRFEVDGRVAYGLVDGDRIRELQGDLFGENTISSVSHDLPKTKLLVPVIPKTFFCIGLNYADHVIRRASLLGRPPVFPEKPDIGYRANNALIAHDDDIVKPGDSGEEFQYEGELVAVFGKRAKPRLQGRGTRLPSLVGPSATTSLSERGRQVTAHCGERRTRIRSSRWVRGS